MNKKIWAHTLIKNEGRWLWYSVTSIADYVEKILLWDTGSSDETLEIIKTLQKKYSDKIDFKKREINTSEDFTKVRQEMLDATFSDWFIVLDGDEIWYEESIKKVVGQINKNGEEEALVVPSVNLVGDIFHYRGAETGKYQFGRLKGHYNLRAVRRNIPGLYSSGIHGVWGWADEDQKQIQDRNTYKFINAPYLHATNLRRSKFDENVIKRQKKLKYEIGKEFPKDFYYPEAFFKDVPDFLESPWTTMKYSFKIRAYLESPARLIKRKLITGRVGY